MPKLTVIFGSLFLLLTLALLFVRRERRRWAGAAAFFGWTVGLILISPGLIHFAPFRSAVLDLASVVAVALLGFVALRIVGSGARKDGAAVADSMDAFQSTVSEPVAQSMKGGISLARDGNAAERDRPLIITLVHGTFQPEASWASAESEFSRTLVDAVPSRVRLERFCWSGSNSHKSRITAANELREHIARLTREYPGVQQICIGHSHGGSVIHYALADPAFESSLVGYAFLSTPFLNFHARQYGDLDATGFLLAALCVVCVTVPSYLIAVRNGWRLTAPLTGLNPMLVAPCLLIPFAFVARFYRRAAVEWKRAAQEFLDTLPKPLCRSDKAVFLRCSGDEASNGLGLIYILTWLQVQSHLRAEAYFAEVERKSAQLRPGSIRGLTHLLVALFVLIATAGWTAVSALLCSVSFRLGFGADIAKHTLFLQVTSEPTPPGKWIVLQLDPHKAPASPNTRAAPLAHSSYAHPDTPKVLAEWARDRMAT